MIPNLTSAILFLRVIQVILQPQSMPILPVKAPGPWYTPHWIPTLPSIYHVSPTTPREPTIYNKSRLYSFMPREGSSVLQTMLAFYRGSIMWKRLGNTALHIDLLKKMN